MSGLHTGANWLSAVASCGMYGLFAPRMAYGPGRSVTLQSACQSSTRS